ncbi:MAG: spore coat U domain-containing protein [Allosphingosinicella sp.]|uniref:Csu type fimbrial protein n=1 Tax=Allosphingosinicella sp. TaxID=2823234 RepID=UPI0039612343
MRDVLRRLSLRAFAPALLGLMPGLAAAESVTSTLSVSAVVEPTCSVALNPVAFGSIDPATGAKANGNLTVTCTPGTGWSASADGGSGGTAGARRMTSGAGTLDYALYTSADRSQAWGDGSGATGLFTGTGTGAPQPFPIHGEIPASQAAAAGNYSDVIAVTVTY